MTPAEIKNVVCILSRVLDEQRMFCIKDDPHNHLTFFLNELNRLRKLINVPPARIDATLPCKGGKTVRFRTTSAPIFITSLSKRKVSFSDMTENEFKRQLIEVFGDMDFNIEDYQNEKQFIKIGCGGNAGLKERLHIGSWFQNSCWYWEPNYSVINLA